MLFNFKGQQNPALTRRTLKQDSVATMLAAVALWIPPFNLYLANYTIEELKWDILILRWSGIGNDFKPV